MAIQMQYTRINDEIHTIHFLPSLWLLRFENKIMLCARYSYAEASLHKSASVLGARSGLIRFISGLYPDMGRVNVLLKILLAQE